MSQTGFLPPLLMGSSLPFWNISNHFISKKLLQKRLYLTLENTNSISIVQCFICALYLVHCLIYLQIFFIYNFQFVDAFRFFSFIYGANETEKADDVHAALALMYGYAAKYAPSNAIEARIDALVVWYYYPSLIYFANDKIFINMNEKSKLKQFWEQNESIFG